jgi:hypothetical protein
MSTTFKQLNLDWNAEPNAPSPRVSVLDGNVTLAFYMNSFQFPGFKEGDVGYVRFGNCWRYRMGVVTDDVWFRGGCRFSKLAPSWGEFYEVSGDLRLKWCRNDWQQVGTRSEDQKHFLFYFRSEEFEVDAEWWSLEVYNHRREITVERSSLTY